MLLWKSVYSYDEYMNDWQKCNETPLPEKEYFYIHLNIEDVTDADYSHAKNFLRTLKQKNLG